MHACYGHERKLPKIPTTEQIKKLIASASPRYAAILKILSETGIMPHELSRISLRDIDLERGFLYVQACMWKHICSHQGIYFDRFYHTSPKSTHAPLDFSKVPGNQDTIKYVNFAIAIHICSWVPS